MEGVGGIADCDPELGIHRLSTTDPFPLSVSFTQKLSAGRTETGKISETYCTAEIA